VFHASSTQVSMFEAEFLLPTAKAQRLQKSWAHGFRETLCSAVDEGAFREVFSSPTGRPNKSVRMMIGLLLLKEMNDLNDEEALEQLDYNLLWHYALAVAPGEAHTCQRTMHGFRVILMEKDRARKVFLDVTRALAETKGFNLAKQRLDSTHVMSNIARLNRLGLFVETVAHFLRTLRREVPEACTQLSREVIGRYLEREGRFADVKRDEIQRTLQAVAEDLFALIA
jgi:transposase